MKLAHFEANGKPVMVNTQYKQLTKRNAVAEATVKFSDKLAFQTVTTKNPKGRLIDTARIAGIFAAKRTDQIIPFCHSIPLAHIDVDVHERAEQLALHITASATCTGATGVEMEALTAASVAALTVYDMCKSTGKGIVITDIRLVSKSGGKSGQYPSEKE